MEQRGDGMSIGYKVCPHKKYAGKDQNADVFNTFSIRRREKELDQSTDQ